MVAPNPDPTRGVRLRRVASYLLDVALLGAPWAAAAGMALAPAGGNSISGLAAFAGVTLFCALASLVLLVLQIVLFLGRGRTLGMAFTGLVATRGVKWVSLLLDPVMMLLTLAVAFPFSYVLTDKGIVSDDTMTVLFSLTPLAAVAFNLALLLLPPRRTLTDFVCGLRVVRDLGAGPSRPGSRQGAFIVDGVLLGVCGAPVLLVVGGSQLLTAALGSAVMLALLVGAELLLWKMTHATLGMRALGLGGLQQP